LGGDDQLENARQQATRYLSGKIEMMMMMMMKHKKMNVML